MHDLSDGGVNYTFGRDVFFAGKDEMQLIGLNRSPFTRRVAITLPVYGMPYEHCALSSFRDRESVRAANPLGEAQSLVLGRLTHADLAAFVTERLARGLGLDTARDTPNLFALTSRLGQTPPFAATEP